MVQSFSVSSEVEHWQELGSTARFPAYAEVSAPLAKAIADHNARVTETCKSIDDAFTGMASAVSQADSATPGTVGDLIAAVEKCRLDRGVCLQSLSEAWQKREELARQSVDEFSKMLPPAEKALTAAREKAHKELASVGCCLEAMLKAQPTLQLAQEQYDFIVDNRVGHVIAAKAAVQNARALISAASDQLRVSREGRESTRKFIARTVRALAAV